MKFPIRMFGVAVVLACALAGCGVAPAPTESQAPASSASVESQGTSGGPMKTSYQLHTITLPANQLPAGYSPGLPKEHPQTEPFNLSIQLPDSWTLELAKEPDTTYGDYLCHWVTFYKDGKEVGYLSYSPVDIFDYDDPPLPDDPGFYTNLYHDLMMPEMVNWNGSYTPVVRTSTSCTATCRVSVINLDGNKPVVAIRPVYSNAILSYNLSLLEYVAVEFADGQPGSQDVWSAIAKSIVMTPISGSDSTPSPYTQTPAQSVSLAFPANELGKTAANASDYDINPFSVSFLLPENWSVEAVASQEEYSWVPLASKYKIFNQDKVCVGVAGCSSYHIRGGYEDAEDDPAAIYSKIATGNEYRFDVGDQDSYRICNDSEYGTTDSVNVKYSAAINGGAEKTNRGIVSYNKNRMVYVAFDFDSAQVSEDQVSSIAQSLYFE